MDADVKLPIHSEILGTLLFYNSSGPQYPHSAAESQDCGEGGVSCGAGVSGQWPPAPAHHMDKRGW